MRIDIIRHRLIEKSWNRNTDCTDDTDAHGYVSVKIRPICVHPCSMSQRCTPRRAQRTQSEGNKGYLKSICAYSLTRISTYCEAIRVGDANWRNGWRECALQRRDSGRLYLRFFISCLLFNTFYLLKEVFYGNRNSHVNAQLLTLVGQNPI